MLDSRIIINCAKRDRLTSTLRFKRHLHDFAFRIGFARRIAAAASALNLRDRQKILTHAVFDVTKNDSCHLALTTTSALEMSNGEPSHSDSTSALALIQRLSVQGEALDIAENALSKRALELQGKEDALQKLTSAQRQLGRALDITKVAAVFRAPLALQQP